MPAFTRLPSGRTRVTIRKRGVYKGATFDTKTEAKRWATIEEANIENSHHGVKRKVKHALLGDLIEKFIDETPQRSETTLALRHRWIVLFGAQPLTKIDKQFGEHIVKTYLQTAQMPHAIKMLKSIAKVIAWGRLVRNLDISEEPLLQVAASYKYSGYPMRYEPRKNIITEDELVKFIEHFEKTQRKHNVAELLRFLAASGMRYGETQRIVENDVSLTEKTVVIRDRKHPTKKLGNHQTVPLIRDAWEIVRRKVEDEGVTGRLFDVPNLSARFAHAGRRIGLEHCNLHDLRRLFVHRCFAMGLTPEWVCVCTGHTSWQVL